MTEEMIVFALQIRAARTLLGWKQSDLADRAGLAQPTVARLEKAGMLPRMSTVNRLRAVFKEYGVEVVDNLPTGGFTIQVSREALSEALNGMVVDGKGQGS